MRDGLKLLCAIVLAGFLTCAAPSAHAATSFDNASVSLVTLQPSGGGLPPLYAGGGKLCTEAVNVCAREMQPLGVPLGGSFTVKIEDHFTATYECIMLEGKPRWAPTAQQGSCAAQPVILLPAKYDADDPWNIG